MKGQRLTIHPLLYGTQILGYTRTGQPIFSLAGGSGEPPPDPKEEKNDEGGDGNGDDKGGQNDDSQNDDKGDGGKGGSDTVSAEEFEALKRRMQAADRRASAAEAKVKEHEDKDKSELQLAQSEAEEAKGRVTALETENKELKAQVAFLQQDKHQFINPRAALRLARDYFDDHSDDDGNVDMDAVLKQVAKDYPELLVKEDKEGEGGGGNQRPSGSPNNGKKKQDGAPDKAALRKKYSALRR